MRLRSGNRRGNNIIEFSLLMPWFVFLFVGIFDFGFYSYSFISTTSGAIAAVNYCAQSSSIATACVSSNATPCQLAIESVQYLPNVGSSLTSCASPVSMTITNPSAADMYGNSYVTVSFSYTTPQLIPIPGLLPGSLTISRFIQKVVL